MRRRNIFAMRILTLSYPTYFFKFKLKRIPKLNILPSADDPHITIIIESLRTAGRQI